MVHRLRLLTTPRLVSRLLPVAALLSQPLAAPAQQNTVHQETQRRLNLAQEAESLAAEGDAAMAAGKSAEAVNRYGAALDRIAPGAPALSAQRQSVVQRFADASLMLAREQADRGELEKAKATLNAVLSDRAAPGYQPAKTLLDQLDDPDRFNPAQSPRHTSETKKVRDLFILAQGNVDIGDFKAAKESYNQILAVDATNTAARRGLERVERLLSDHLRSERDYTRAKMINDVDGLWETSIGRTPLSPKGTLGAGEHLSGGSSGPSTARVKMDTLRLDRLSMDDTPIDEALIYLARKSIEIDISEPDPDRKGVNIVFNPAGKATGDFKPITLDLRNQSLGDALRAIADQSGTRFSTEGNTITVTPLGVGSKIVLRTFRVPPGFLTRSGTASTGAAEDPFGGNAPDAGSGLKITRLSAKDWLVQNGVPFPEGTSADYSPASNSLFVRNTEENLELVQTVVDSNTDKSQRMVKLQVVLLKTESKRLQELGMDWLIGPHNVGGSGLFGAGGTVGNATNPAQAADFPLQFPGGAGAVGGNAVTSGLRGAFDLQTNPTIDSIIANGTSGGVNTVSRSPGIFSTAGVFTSPQFQNVLRGLNQKKGIDLSTAQTIVLKAGQRATASSVRTIRFPTEFDPPQIPQTIRGGPEFIDLDTGEILSSPSSGTAPVTPTTPQSFEDKDTGSSIEVEATIGDDGMTVDLNLSVVFREFDGFINFGSPITTGDTVLTDNKILQPVFTKVEESAQVQIYDGATVSIGGLSDAKYDTIEDKVPLLGDIPVLGRLFRSNVNQVTQKAVVYFVTVQVVDPGGVGVQEAAAAAEQAAAAAPNP